MSTIKGKDENKVKDKDRPTSKKNVLMYTGLHLGYLLQSTQLQRQRHA